MNLVKIFEFLDELRESGVINMALAAPYIQTEFGVERRGAILILKQWRDTFKVDEDRVASL